MNKNLPDAYIFDIDGTIAIMGDRSIHEYYKVGLDTTNEHVVKICRSIATNVAVILCTGRREDCKGETVEWLANNHVPYSMLLMRKSGDFRQDTIVKKELYDAYIKGKYNILGVFEDRKQVVDMWRELGLTCFQVAEGNF